MKRLSGLILTAAVAWPAGSLTAADPGATGPAPTSPQVPAPRVRDGHLVPPVSGAYHSAETGADQVYMPAGGPAVGYGVRGFGGGAFKSMFGQSPAKDCDPHDPLCRKPKWCGECAPAVRYPLPPPPAGSADGGVRRIGHFEPTPACAAGGCAGGDDRSCWERFKGWLCFRQTPVKLPRTPTARITPAYTYFPCVDRPGGGCSSGNCGAGVSGAGGHASLMPGRGVNGCVSCPTAGEAVMPGYRLANPNPPAGGATGGVISTSYSLPPKPTAKP